MTPAEKRILELVDRWLTSLDLHLRYSKLDDAAYWQVQSWPKHDRPNRWILELARQKVLELKAQCQSQAAKDNGKFAEALELMAFLANLVGSQHVQRFIPLADPDKEIQTADSTVEQPQPEAVSAAAKDDNDRTREMPRPPLNTRRTPPAHTAKTAHAPAAEVTTTNKVSHPQKIAHASPEMQDVVVADAVRLMKWGRQWHELAELIARMAERPNLTEVRRILRARKSEIEELATA